MALILFTIGLITFLAGLIILARTSHGHDVQTLANQTARLAQKGLAEDVAGLVGNASTLMEALNQLVLTRTGVGLFLSMLGLVLIGIACWLVIQTSKIGV
jgi:hypothetical protein